MKILMIVHGFPPECSGGTEHLLEAVCRKLVARGHAVEVFCGSHEGAGGTATTPRLETTKHKGLAVHRLHRTGLWVDAWDKSFAPEVAPPLESILARFRPDIVHVHHWIRLTRNLVEICHDRGVPAVCTLHDLGTTCPKAFRVREGSFCARPVGPESCLGCVPAGETLDEREERQELELYRDDFANELHLARRLIVPTLAHRDVIVSHHSDLLPRIRVVGHGRLSDLRPQSSRPRDGTLRIGHWGHLSALKGIDLLLDACAKAPWRHRVKLEIFGTVVYPEERPIVERLATLLDVTWHGAYTPKDLQDVPMDVAVIPTRCSESWSFVLDEAFLLGLPVIVSDLGALKERIGKAGIVFRAGDSADLARALGEIVQDPWRLEEFRKHIPEIPPLDLQISALEDVYREVTTSRAALPVTSSDLRARRERHRAVAVEQRNRRREVEASVLENLRADLDRAQHTLEEMNFYHGEKDKELSRLGHEVRSRDDALARHLAETEAHIANATRSALDRMADLESRHLQIERTEERRAERDHRRRTRLARRLLEARASLRDLKGYSATLRTLTEATESLRELMSHECRDLATTMRGVDDATRRLASLDAHWQALSDPQDLSVPLGAATIDDVSPPDQDARDLLDGLERVRCFLTGANTSQQRLHTVLERHGGVVGRMGETLERLTETLTRYERRNLASHPRRATQTAGSSRPTRLKILFVVHQFLPRHVAGTEVYTYNLAKQLAKDHDVVILTAESDHSRPRYEHTRTTFDGLKIHQVIHNYTWHHFRDLYDSPESDAIFRSVLREEQPDVLHIQHLHYFSVNFSSIARRKGIPVVYTLHDYGLLCPRDGQMRRADGERCERPIPSKCKDCISQITLSDGPPMVPRGLRPGADALVPDEVARAVRLLRSDPGDAAHEQAIVQRLEYLRSVLADVDLFLSPSRFLRDVFAGSGMIASDRILVSDNGLDLSLFPPARSPRAKRGPGLRLGYVGTIAEHKGLSVLVEAMNRIDDPLITCRIWGDLRAFAEFTTHLRGLIRNPQTLLMGPFPPDRVQGVMSDHDVLVVPSLWWENAPLTLREAALVGIPVLGARLGGIAESVIDGVTGRLYDADDPDDLARRIREMASGDTPLPGFDPNRMVVKDIRADARDLVGHYRALLSRRASAAGPR